MIITISLISTRQVPLLSCWNDQIILSAVLIFPNLSDLLKVAFVINTNDNSTMRARISENVSKFRGTFDSLSDRAVC